MGLNDIRLPASLIASLYTHSLNGGDKGDAVIVSPKTSNLPGYEGADELALKTSPDPTETYPPAVTKVSNTQKAKTEFKFLGNNQKNILIVVSYAAVPHLPDEELGFLTKMLEACKLSLGDVAIVNHHNYPGTVAKDYLGYFESKIVFLFGIDPLSFGLPVSFPAYQVQAVAKTNYLFTPPLEERIADPLFKSKLWVSLKRIFGI